MPDADTGPHHLRGGAADEGDDGDKDDDDDEQSSQESVLPVIQNFLKYEVT